MLRPLAVLVNGTLMVFLALAVDVLGAQQEAPGTVAIQPEAPHSATPPESAPTLAERANLAANTARELAQQAETAARKVKTAPDAKSARDAASAAAAYASLADAQVAAIVALLKLANLSEPGLVNEVTTANSEAVTAAKAAHSAATLAYNSVNSANNTTWTCAFNWNDCDWQYWVIGGGEESASSSQDSQTNPFVSLFVRAPVDNRNGSVWLLARFLGAANANNTNNVVTAVQSATGSTATSGLPQIGTALDYVFGVQHDWFMPSPDHPYSGGFSIGGIVGFGATTPLSAQHATTAYVVPAYGSNECNGLLSRFPSSRGQLGLPTQPNSPYITTTTISGSGTSSTTTSGPYCIINPVSFTSTTTSNGSTSTMTVSGTAQTDLAFAPEDRNSFLLKYMIGVRLINRWHNKDGPNAKCATDTSDTRCTRTVVDLTVGQDEAITGGMLRHFVGKTEAAFPIPGATSICFFGSASIRLSRSQNQSPLILQPATVVTSSPSPPATTSVPSSTTWVLPLTQPNRDFYRIGIGVDLTSLLAKAFSPKS